MNRELAEQIAMNAVARRETLERNSRHYHKYRHAVQGLLDAVPDDYPVPVGLGYALGVLREVHEEAEGEA